MSVAIEPLGKHDLMAKIDGPHGTRPVVGIAYRQPDGDWYRVWEVAEAGHGALAENVTRDRARVLLKEIGARATERAARPAPVSSRPARPGAWRDEQLQAR